MFRREGKEDAEDKDEASFGSFPESSSDQTRSPPSRGARSAASVRSGPSTVSSYQSSLFSRQASSANTADTSIHSYRGPKQENGAERSGDSGSVFSHSSTSSQQGRPMRVMNLQDVSSSFDDANVPTVGASSRHRDADPYHIIELAPESTNIYGPAPRRYSQSRSSQSGQVHNLASSSTPATSAVISRDLSRLATELKAIHREGQPHAMVAITQALRMTTQLPQMASISEGQVSLTKEDSLRTIIKIVLYHADNSASDNSQRSATMFMIQALYELGTKLKLVSESNGPVKYPSNFALVPGLPGYEILGRVMDKLYSGQHELPGIREQEGAFAAPVLRGFSPEFSIPTVAFGFPDPSSEHYAMVRSMYDISPEIHMFCHKNYIRAAATSATATAMPPASPAPAPRQTPKFKSPFRVPINAKAPPMGMSIATDNAINLSGTMGGYVYPKIDPSHPFYSSYGKSTFAITCAHTCLTESGGLGQPLVSTPSPVLIGLYKNALIQERSKYPPRSEEFAGYQNAIDEIDEQYPIDKDTQRNKPPSPLGRISWAERRVVDGSLSDVAIIKCSSDLKCRNYLGDDVPFTEYDPSLIYGNLYVKRIVHKLPPGAKVFKYGSTSKYTKGRINGMRIVYWSSGRLQSSEFAVASDNMFATGGDSGAWILQKSEDIDSPDPQNRSGPCLGTAGMLHSYDGERKEFGLFTPIDNILRRLHQVTNIKWGVVGVPDEDNEDTPAGGSETDGSNDGND